LVLASFQSSVNVLDDVPAAYYLIDFEQILVSLRAHCLKEFFFDGCLRGAILKLPELLRIQFFQLDALSSLQLIRSHAKSLSQLLELLLNDFYIVEPLRALLEGAQFLDGLFQLGEKSVEILEVLLADEGVCFGGLRRLSVAVEVGGIRSSEDS